MGSQFTFFDWMILAAYLIILFLSGYKLSRKNITDNKDFYLARNASTPTWVATLSVVATAMSGATFLGAPNNSFGGDWSYLASFIGLLIGSVFVAYIIIPRFYQYKVTTVYELLLYRYGPLAKTSSGIMYIIGRFLASGSRLYMAGLAVSMILFNDITFSQVSLSTAVIVILGLAYTWIGGIRSVMWGDVVQLFIFVGAAVIVIFTILASIPADMGTIIDALQKSPAGSNGEVINKLQIFKLDFSFQPWDLSIILTGWVLFSIASWGLDQDMTQRMLACKNQKEGMKAAWVSVLYQIPIVIVFLFIGSLLYIYYQRPDIMLSAGTAMGDTAFHGDDRIRLTTIMYYALNELGAGFKGLIAIGVIAAAFSSVNSGLNSMSSVLIEDLYRPLMAKNRSETHYLSAGRYAMLFVAIILTIVAMLCYYWQRYTDTPLLNFALGIMGFAYAGLLGVYGAALFTKRGSDISVTIALIVGFIIMLWSQFFWPDILGGKWNAFLMIIPATFVSFLIAIMGKSEKTL